MAKLPGLGKRSAKRAVLYMLKNKESYMEQLADSIKKAAETTKICEECGNLDTSSPCDICTDEKREPIICVVEEVADLWAFERGNVFGGKYHVLGGVLSAVDGVGPADLNIDKLLERIEKENTEEVVIATNATVEGQTTAHYITERLKDLGVKTSRIAHGIPIGGEMDYLDDGTLSAALKSRQSF